MLTYIKKHKQVIITVGAMSLVGVIGLIIGSKMEIKNTDNGLIHIGDTGEQISKIVGNIEYTVTVTKEQI